jgi:SAM-dependent methyltransferase
MRYTSPRPADAVLLDAYRRLTDEPFTAEREARERTYRPALKRIETLLGGRRGRLLDAGCGPGFFVALARDAGWDAEGLDPSPWNAAYGARELGVRIQVAAIGEADLPPAAYDAVVLWDVVEHLTRPREDLARLSAALKPGGVLAAGTHSIASPAAWLLGRRYPFLMAMHVAHFSPRTLARLCAAAGLESIRTAPHRRVLRGGYLATKAGHWFPALAPAIRRGVDLLGLERRYITARGLGLFELYARRRP